MLRDHGHGEYIITLVYQVSHRLLAVPGLSICSNENKTKMNFKVKNSALYDATMPLSFILLLSGERRRRRRNFILPNK